MSELPKPPRFVRDWMNLYQREWRRKNPLRAKASHLRRKAKERADPTLRREARKRFKARLRADPERAARYRRMRNIGRKSRARSKSQPVPVPSRPRPGNAARGSAAVVDESGARSDRPATTQREAAIQR